METLLAWPVVNAVPLAPANGTTPRVNIPAARRGTPTCSHFLFSMFLFKIFSPHLSFANQPIWLIIKQSLPFFVSASDISEADDKIHYVYWDFKYLRARARPNVYFRPLRT